MENLAITDYGAIPNGLFHFKPPTSGRVSFDIEWSGVSSRQKVRNADPAQRRVRDHWDARHLEGLGFHRGAHLRVERRWPDHPLRPGRP